MEEIQRYLKQYLLRLSIDPTHKGYKQLYDCVIARMAKETTITEIYTEVGKKYNVQGKTVLRNVTYALNKAERLEERLSEVLGIRIEPNAMHTGLVITYLAEIVKEPEVFELPA